MLKLKAFGIILLGSIAAAKVSAQTVDGSPLHKYSAEAGEIYEGDVAKYTLKYANIDTARVEFNREVVKFIVFKTTDKCSEDHRGCDQDGEPMIVPLEVKAVVISKCYDSYYAQTPTAEKSEIFEEIIINRFAKNRCQTIKPVREGFLHYRVTGTNSETGQLGHGNAWVELDNIIVLKNSK